jgi:hypothetical protein
MGWKSGNHVRLQRRRGATDLLAAVREAKGTGWLEHHSECPWWRMTAGGARRFATHRRKLQRHPSGIGDIGRPGMVP